MARLLHANLVAKAQQEAQRQTIMVDLQWIVRGEDLLQTIMVDHQVKARGACRQEAILHRDRHSKDIQIRGEHLQDQMQDMDRLQDRTRTKIQGTVTEVEVMAADMVPQLFKRQGEISDHLQEVRRCLWNLQIKWVVSHQCLRL